MRFPLLFIFIVMNCWIILLTCVCFASTTSKPRISTLNWADFESSSDEDDLSPSEVKILHARTSPYASLRAEVPPPPPPPETARSLRINAPLSKTIRWAPMSSWERIRYEVRSPMSPPCYNCWDRKLVIPAHLLDPVLPTNSHLG